MDASPGGRIKIPGSLPTDDLSPEADEDRRHVGRRTPDSAASAEAPDAEALDADDNEATDSDEYLSDLDPDTPHYAEGERPTATPSAAVAGDVGVGGRRRQRESPPQAPEQLLARSQRLARRFAARGQANNALRQLVRQTALSVLVYGPQHSCYAASYTELARGYLDLKGNSFAQQAEEHAAHAKNILLGQAPEEQSLMSEPDRLEFLKVSISTFHTLGRAQSLLKKHAEAEQSLLKAEKLLRELRKLPIVTFDFLQETRIKVWTSLAKISSRLAKPAVAMSYYDQAIAACEKRFGKTAPQLVPLYQGAGNVEQSRPEFPNHEKAVDLYLKAHEIATAQAGGEYSASSAATARALSAAYSRCGTGVADNSAESYLQESLAAHLQLHGPEHPVVCEVQDEMAKLLIRTDRADEGTKMLQDTLKVKARVFGDYSQEVLDSFRILGSLSLSRGQLDKALADLQKAKDIAEFLQGPASRVAKELGSTIDTILKHPSMEGKQSGYDMKNRPRFNGIVARSRSAAAAGAGGGGVFN